MDPYHNLEDKVQSKAAFIDAAMVKEIPSLFDQRKWLGRIMSWVMQDERFKVRLFRFIDVLPSLKSDEMVLRLLNEYFSEELDAPLIIRHGIERIAKGTVPAFAAARIARSGVETLASQFIAGRNPGDALAVIEALMKKSISCSIDLLGEVVLSEREAGAYAARYLDLLDTVHDKLLIQEEIRAAGLNPGAGISLKISSFYSQLDPVDWEGSVEKTKNALIPIFEKAARKGIGVTLDMEHYLFKDLTIAVFKNVLEELRDFPFAGITLQTYLKGSRDDLLDLIGWAGEKKKRITIRLVKGAYWDHEIIVNRQKGWPIPVFQRKEDTDRNFEDLTSLLLENAGIVYPAIATHNLRSLSHAAAVAELLGLDSEGFEFQFLNGMAVPLRNALRGLDYRVTVYTPVGEFIPGMAYLIRRLLENTANESFLRKSLFEKRSFGELMRSPGQVGNGPSNEKTEKDFPFRNEPPLDFSKAVNREKMRYALGKVKKEFGRKYSLSVGGREIRTESEMLSLNPAAPDQVVGRVSSASEKIAGEAVSEARKAWATWRMTSPDHRAIILLRAAHEIRKKRLELAALQVYEVGKTWREADGDVSEAVDYCEYYSRQMKELGTARRLGDYPGETNEYFYEPRGVGVVISPWNFPLAIPMGMVSAGLVTGNCVIFKPSGLSPVTGWNLVSAFHSAGLPEGVLQFLPGPGGEVGEYLVSHPDIDFIAFTGSKDVGLRIIRLAGETVPGQRNVKKVVAEMGGKNAVIIDDTADLDEAVRGVLESALGYQGQKCSACSRTIIVGGMFGEFVDRLKQAMESILIGPTEDPANFMGPVIDKAALEKIMRYKETGKKEGKTVLIREVQRQGYYVGPSIFSDIDPGSPVAQDEIFGPILVVMRAEDIDKALEMANGTPYALTGGLYSRSPANIRKVKSEFRAGNLYINRPITGALVGRQPFGGYGLSGVGSKAGGPDYLLQFMNPKSSSENTSRKGFAPGVM